MIDKGFGNNIDEPVDIVLPWVDGSDDEWLTNREKYSNFNSTAQADANGIERYRDWENLKYVFRGIDKYLPWVRYVFFVTCGQRPSFLNDRCEKLKLVNHADYIPGKYLPTFNTRTIEMNLHRIGGLSDKFIYFNDDTYIIDKIEKNYFIKNNIPSDEAIERIIGNTGLVYGHCMINHAWIINKYFNKKESKKRHWRKWYNPCYGTGLLRNVLMDCFHDFEALRNPHEPNLLRKEVIAKLWELEPEILDAGSCNKFRSINDVTQNIIRYWNILEGNFNPRKHRGKMWTVNNNNYREIAESIRIKKYPLLCIDEKVGERLTEFEAAKREINEAFEYILPKKSCFEV